MRSNPVAVKTLKFILAVVQLRPMLDALRREIISRFLLRLDVGHAMNIRILLIKGIP